MILVQFKFYDWQVVFPVIWMGHKNMYTGVQKFEKNDEVYTKFEQICA